MAKIALFAQGICHINPVASLSEDSRAINVYKYRRKIFSPLLSFKIILLNYLVHYKSLLVRVDFAVGVFWSLRGGVL
jgi:hypothetical protein